MVADTSPTINRIMIFGRPGSGKSTFALKLHMLLGLPLFHLDKYFYVKDWVERDKEEFLDIQETLVEQQSWIIDGNCTGSLATRFKKADVCLYFNMPRWQCYLRIVKRWFFKNPAIDDRAPGCKETVQLSLLTYMWSFEKRVARAIPHLKKTYPHVHFFEIKNQHDLEQAERFLHHAAQ
jgi:adenylate kinase family enzyme